MPKPKPFSFEISLSVLNHLGRNLYRSFNTVLGEAISNSWDADAKNVWIYVDRPNNSFVIKDDGDGMTATDFQKKFLKIGYSKRKKGINKSKGNRPFIGRKGIGKLALLSCADRISIISKTARGQYVGGSIDNSGLDEAIQDDLTPQEYPLEKLDLDKFSPHTAQHDQGTIILFEGIKGGIKNSLDILKKIIALYFRFSLLDPGFNIYIDDEKITFKHIKSLAEKTEFLWVINNLKDPYISRYLKNLKEKKSISASGSFKGFIASVSRPRDLAIMGLEERVSVDLFVNGRLREKNILKHIPTSRIVEDYIYGQIHFDILDDSKDRFTSDREGVVADDTTYQLFLKKDLLEGVIRIVTDDWDKWRIKHREDGDPENPRISTKDRKSGELFNAVSEGYTRKPGFKNKTKIDKWVEKLSGDATFNFGSYAECFVSENLIREFIRSKRIAFSPEAVKEITKWKKQELESKNAANISIDIRAGSDDSGYLGLSHLANLADKTRQPDKEAALSRDAREYKPMRDAIAHTALLAPAAKSRLTAVFENIKARINTLLG